VTGGTRARPTCGAAAAAVLAAVLATAAPVAGQATRPAAGGADVNVDAMPLRRATRDAGAAAAATTADAQATATSTGLDTTRVVVSLAGVLGLIFLLKHFGKGLVTPRGGGGGPSGAVQLLGRDPIGPRQQVILLRIGRRVIVVADSAGVISTLSQITDADEVAELTGRVQQGRPASATKAFGALLGRANELFAAQAKPAAADKDTVAVARADEENADADDMANVEPLAVAETRRDLEQLLGRIRGLSQRDGGSSVS